MAPSTVPSLPTFKGNGNLAAGARALTWAGSVESPGGKPRRRPSGAQSQAAAPAPKASSADQQSTLSADHERSLAMATFEHSLDGNDVERAMMQLAKEDRKGLESQAHKKARQVLRALSYPALPSRRDADAECAAQPRDPGRPVVGRRDAEKQPRIPPLEQALTMGATAAELRGEALEARLPLTQDAVTQMCAAGASLDWVDVQRLSAELLGDAAASRGGAPRASQAKLQRAPTARSLDAGLPPARCEWPSLEAFERHYHRPEPAAAASSSSSAAAARRRRGAALLTDWRSEVPRPWKADGGAPKRPVPFAATRSVADPTPGHASWGKPEESRRFKLFEAAAVYRTACNQLGIPSFEPPPVFNELVEVGDIGCEGTKQCYAIAEAIRVCAPLAIKVTNAFLTDEGAARIIQAAIWCGKLRSLSISGSILSYKTCLAIQAGLRASGGANLSELSLTACGLGGWLEDGPPIPLPTSAEEKYQRAKDELWHGAPAAGPAVLDEAPGSRSASKASREASKVSLGGEAGAAEEEGEEDENPPGTLTPWLLPVYAQLARPTCLIRYLDLSRTVIQLSAAEGLGQCLKTAPIEVLILNQCDIDDDEMAAVSLGIAENKSLRELRLRNNQLKNEPGCAALLTAVGKHPRLAHLDIAENIHPRELMDELLFALRWSLSLVAVHVLGAPVKSRQMNELAVGLSEYCMENLTHPTEQDKDALADAKANLEHKGICEEMVICRALHVEGLKEWRVMSPVPPERDPVERKKQAAKNPHLETELKSFTPSCCWVCNKCEAREYQWIVPDKGPGSDTGVAAAKMFVRPSFAGFTRIELRRQRTAIQGHVNFSTKVMAPPGAHSHLFESELGYAKTLLCSTREEIVEVEDVELQEEEDEALKKLYAKKHYSGPVNVPPPVTTEGFKIPDMLLEKIEVPVHVDPWQDEAKRRELLRECFFEDLKTLHIGDLCHRDEEGEVADTLWELYSVFYETYVIFAGRGSEWPRVRQLEIYDFYQQAGILDRGPIGPDAWDPAVINAFPLPRPLEWAPKPAAAGAEDFRLLDTNEIRQILTQTTAYRGDPPKGDAIQQRAAMAERQKAEAEPLIRPQFLEVLIRTAIVLRGRNPSIAHAIRRFANGVLLPRVLQAPLSPYPRGLHQKVGEVCDALLAWRKTIRDAWERFGGNELQFRKLTQLLKLCDKVFTFNDVMSIYALSRLPEPDPRSKGKTAGLRYDEFCEAVARLSLVYEDQQKNGLPGAVRQYPAMPQVGKAVREREVAQRLEAFLAKVSERVEPPFRIDPDFDF